MSRRGPQEYLADVREAILRIQSYTSAITYDEFLADAKTQDAVISQCRNPWRSRETPPGRAHGSTQGIAWQSISGMRDKLVHDYFGVNVDIL